MNLRDSIMWLTRCGVLAAFAGATSANAAVIVDFDTLLTNDTGSQLGVLLDTVNKTEGTASNQLRTSTNPPSTLFKASATISATDFTGREFTLDFKENDNVFKAFVTLFNPGLAEFEQFQLGDLGSGDWVTNPFTQGTGSQSASFDPSNVTDIQVVLQKPGTVTGSLRVDANFDNLVLTPLPVSFTNVTVSDVMGMEFESDAGTTYGLEYSLPAMPDDWNSAGVVLTGVGGPMQFFDPTGFSTSRTYRILQNP